MAAAPPTFKLTLRVSDNDGGAVRYQQEEGRSFPQAQTIKLLTHEPAYNITLELEDVGGTVSGIARVVVDDSDAEVVGRAQRQNEGSGTTVFVVNTKWKPSSWHWPATPKGSRDEVPVAVTYTHAGTERLLRFKVQAKFYERGSKKRLGKARDDGKVFKSAWSRYNGATDGASLRQPWKFEVMESIEPMADLGTSWRAPPPLPSDVPAPQPQQPATPQQASSSAQPPTDSANVTERRKPGKRGVLPNNQSALAAEGDGSAAPAAEATPVEID